MSSRASRWSWARSNRMFMDHLLSRSQRSAPAAQATRVEIPGPESPSESAPHGVKQETQGDAIPCYPALPCKLDVHGPSFHNALSACSSTLRRYCGLRLIGE